MTENSNSFRGYSQEAVIEAVRSGDSSIFGEALVRHPLARPAIELLAQPDNQLSTSEEKQIFLALLQLWQEAQDHKGRLSPDFLDREDEIFSQLAMSRQAA